MAKIDFSLGISHGRPTVSPLLHFCIIKVSTPWYPCDPNTVLLKRRNDGMLELTVLWKRSKDFTPGLLTLSVHCPCFCTFRNLGMKEIRSHIKKSKTGKSPHRGKEHKGKQFESASVCRDFSPTLLNSRHCCDAFCVLQIRNLVRNQFSYFKSRCCISSQESLRFSSTYMRNRILKQQARLLVSCFRRLGLDLPLKPRDRIGHV